MKVLIIDDDKDFIQKLKKDFHRYFSPYYDISYELRDSDYSLIESKDIDIAFIDIDLQTNNGIDIAKQLRQQFPHLIIIFISGREDLVFRTFSIGVFQFIRKAKYDNDIDITWKQLETRLKNQYNQIIITYNKKQYKYTIDKIEYILSIGHDVIIHSSSREDIFHKISINDILDMFQSSQLIQIQRNMVINFHYIKEIKKTEVTTLNGKVYKIGRPYQSQFMKKYKEFLLR